jgi:hypothetical protein
MGWRRLRRKLGCEGSGFRVFRCHVRVLGTKALKIPKTQRRSGDAEIAGGVRISEGIYGILNALAGCVDEGQASTFTRS